MIFRELEWRAALLNYQRSSIDFQVTDLVKTLKGLDKHYQNPNNYYIKSAVIGYIKLI